MAKRKAIPAIHDHLAWLVRLGDEWALSITLASGIAARAGGMEIMVMMRFFVSGSYAAGEASRVTPSPEMY
jgi:hypothetical protein